MSQVFWTVFRVAPFFGFPVLIWTSLFLTSPFLASSYGQIASPREFSPYLEGDWIGQAVSYGAFREGQAPGGEKPSCEELREDLYLLAKHWHLLRMYGSTEVAGDVLKIVHEEKLPIRVMLGAWIARESVSEGSEAGSEEAKAAANTKRGNEEQVAEVIRLANRYPDEVLAVSVGNETQVFWSGHRTEQDVLIRYLREVRAATTVPVATADDFSFWKLAESKAVAAEVDFIVTHIHAMWLGQELPTAMAWTKETYAEVCKHHPEKTVVIGEAGWATQVHDEGEQAKLIKGEAGEAQQRVYYQQFTDWASKEKVCTFFFEAFDEPWKGGPHPNEVEKHWGLFYVDRTPKAAMSGASKANDE